MRRALTDRRRTAKGTRTGALKRRATVSRDLGDDLVSIWLNTTPYFERGSWWPGTDNAEKLFCCVALFRSVFGFCPRMGECKLVEFAGKVVKGKENK